MKMRQHFHGQNKVDIHNHLPRGGGGYLLRFLKINFNPYKMSDNIFYTTVLPVLNSSEIEVTD
jgi:hypothetical protein